MAMSIYEFNCCSRLLPPTSYLPPPLDIQNCSSALPRPCRLSCPPVNNSSLPAATSSPSLPSSAPLRNNIFLLKRFQRSWKFKWLCNVYSRFLRILRCDVFVILSFWVMQPKNPHWCHLPMLLSVQIWFSSLNISQQQYSMKWERKFTFAFSSWSEIFSKKTLPRKVMGHFVYLFTFGQT